MTQTLPGADIRRYYAALGIALPTWASENANVRCFADPDAHHHGDRHASCSVNLTTGAYNCHGCSAHGGAYDAALELGHTPRSAIEQMIRYELVNRRHTPPHRRATPSSHRPREESGQPRRRSTYPRTTVERGREHRPQRRDVLHHRRGARPRSSRLFTSRRTSARSTSASLSPVKNGIT
jgi:hypothetical protein